MTVPVHKVDDITHVNFTDRDHLWFDPNWKNSGGNGGERNGVGTSASNASGGTNNNAGEDDPMAVMLENNAKNTNAANIFVNKLHGLVSEYAEVNHSNLMQENRTSNNTNNGPYATTTLIDPSNVSYVLPARPNIFFLKKTYLTSTYCDEG